MTYGSAATNTKSALATPECSCILLMKEPFAMLSHKDDVFLCGCQTYPATFSSARARVARALVLLRAESLILFLALFLPPLFPSQVVSHASVHAR